MIEHIFVDGQEYSWHVRQEGEFYTLYITSDDNELDIEMPLGEYPQGVDFGMTPSFVRFVIESTRKAID